MLFERFDLVYVLLPVVVCLMVVSLVLRSRVNRRERDPVIRALRTLKINSIGCGVMCLVLWFALPSTPALSTFGLPQNLNQIQSGPSLLALLQSYNRALVRTTDVLYWFLFTFVWWFLTSYHDFAKVVADAMHRQVAGGGNLEAEASENPDVNSTLKNFLFWIVLVLVGLLIWNLSTRW